MSTRWSVPSQRGRIALVTGANSGIGWHTALELARAGAEVIVTARTAEKAADAIARIRAEVADANVRSELLDLADLASVRAFPVPARLDLLINNAGVMAVPTRQLTKDGFEVQLGTNYIGPFALTQRLLPALRASDAPRVTTVSSGAANMGDKRIRFDDLQWTTGYKPWKAYCQSKLADLMLTTELGRREPKILSTAAHPGYARTNLQTSGPGRPVPWYQRLAATVISQDAAHGALPTLRAAVDPGLVSGAYFGPKYGLKGPPVAITLPKPARDAEAAKRLWDVTEQLIAAKNSTAAA